MFGPPSASRLRQNARPLPPAAEWTNVRTLGVAGDGKTGDTAAIQRQSTGAGACSPIPKPKQETGPLSEQAG
jgi:hypothetical protein